MFKTPLDVLLTNRQHLALKEARQLEQKLINAQVELDAVEHKTGKSCPELHQMMDECLEKIRERIDILQEEVLLCHSTDASSTLH